MSEDAFSFFQFNFQTLDSDRFSLKLIYSFRLDLLRNIDDGQFYTHLMLLSCPPTYKHMDMYAQ